MPKILVTGAAGFIGFHMVRKLSSAGYQVVGIDNLNSYYDPELKKGRLRESGIADADLKDNELMQSSQMPSYSFAKLDIRDKTELENLFRGQGFDFVLHLAAQAGVRLFALACSEPPKGSRAVDAEAAGNGSRGTEHR